MEQLFFLRAYRPEDCGAVTKLFYDTVHTINTRDYSPQQVDAWAPKQPDMDRWNTSLLGHRALVAVGNGGIWGFGDMDETGYLDRLYVHRDHQGQGVGKALCDALESEAPGDITTHASITARPFFEHRGYRMVKAQTVVCRGVEMTNFIMVKPAK